MQKLRNAFSTMQTRLKRHWKPLLTGDFVVRGLLKCLVRSAFCVSVYENIARELCELYMEFE